MRVEEQEDRYFSTGKTSVEREPLEIIKKNIQNMKTKEREGVINTTINWRKKKFFFVIYESGGWGDLGIHTK